MRRGAQGHVEAPRGPRECLHGTEVTCHVFIFNRNSMVIVHISIRYFGFKLMAIISSPYIRTILHLFIRVGLCSLFYLDCRTRGEIWSVGWESR